MKADYLLYLLPLSLLTCALTSVQAKDTPPKLETDAQVYSYGVGYQIGGQLLTGPIELDIQALSAGLKDALAGNGLVIEEQRLQEVAERVQQEMMAKQQAEMAATASTNAAASASFLETNAAKANVVTLDSGLQYRIIESAEGEIPSANDTVVVNYRGSLIDGTEFDSSYSRGEPAQFPVHSVIPGWREALQLMPTGSKWELFVPPALAYGAGGQGPIPPNATLIFEIELIEITPPASVAEDAHND